MKSTTRRAPAAKAQPEEVDTLVRWKKIAPKSVPFAQYERDVREAEKTGAEDATRYHESELPEKLEAAKRQAAEDYERHSPELFTLSATYRVAPGTTGIQLHDDIGCWLESAEDIVSCLALQHSGQFDQPNDLSLAGALYGAKYLIQMARGALAAAHRIDADAGLIDAEGGAA